MVQTLKKIVFIFIDWMVNKKTGNLQFNFFKGGISAINFNDTKKLGDINIDKIIIKDKKLENDINNLIK
ncbi:MAG: hypothetical protein ACFFG0_06235 [Candidatus Thorarchaeota archaeon]